MSEKLVLITTKPDANKVSKPYRDMVMDAFERLTDEKNSLRSPRDSGLEVTNPDRWAQAPVTRRRAPVHLTPGGTMIRIRELEWRGVGDRIEASALGLEVFYRVEGQPGDWTLISPGATSYVRTLGYQSQAAAKAAAQVDFDRRIRAELDQST